MHDGLSPYSPGDGITQNPDHSQILMDIDMSVIPGEYELDCKKLQPLVP
jgi:hypothetical protein